MSVSVLGDLQLPIAKKQGEQQSRESNRASSPTSKTGFEKVFTEDVVVEVVEPLPTEDVRLDLEDQATECSSSFDGTQNELGIHEVRDDGSEVESQLREGNGAFAPTEENAQLSKRKKRALTSEWKTYRQGIEWRCRWIELRVKELQEESAKYDEILKASKSSKQKLLEQQDGSAARTNTLFNYAQKNRALRRRRRRRAEEDADLKSLMSRHPLFPRYEKRKRRDHEDEVSAEDMIYDDESHQILQFDDMNRPEDQEFDEELGEEFTREEDSMEQLLWHIEALQMHVVKLKNQLSRGAPLRRNAAMAHFRDVPSSSPRSLGHLSLFASPRTLGGQMQLQCASRSGARPILSGSKIHASSSISRRRNSDYDINNVVMPGNAMANYVEPARHAFIETPHWRLLADNPVPDGEGSSNEDTDDELYRKRHAEMEVKERQQQYAPWSKNRNMPFGKGSSKSGAKGMVKVFGKGVDVTSNGVLVEDDSDHPTGFGFVPKRKRRKRESRDIASITKRIEPLYASLTEPLEGCNQDQLSIKMEDGKVNSYMDFSKD